jgi:hypothetical protein
LRKNNRVNEAVRHTAHAHRPRPTVGIDWLGTVEYAEIAVFDAHHRDHVSRSRKRIVIDYSREVFKTVNVVDGTASLFDHIYFLYIVGSRNELNLPRVWSKLTFL